MSVGPGSGVDCVATEEVELERVGDAGLPVVDAGGDGAVNEVAEFR